MIAPVPGHCLTFTFYGKEDIHKINVSFSQLRPPYFVCYY